MAAKATPAKRQKGSSGEAENSTKPTPRQSSSKTAVVSSPPEPQVPREAVSSVPESSSRPRYDGDSAIKLYLREIGQVPLLTIQEEIDLAARIKQGDRQAREHMIKANLRLVVKIAHDYEGDRKSVV